MISSTFPTGSWAKACLLVMLAINATAGGQTKDNDAKKNGSIPVSGFDLRGGFVNFVEGKGHCRCAQPPNDRSKQPLTNGDVLELDEGHAEAVLIPGYYLRLSSHTLVGIVDLARDNLKIGISTGSVIIEIPMESGGPLPSQIQEIKDRVFPNVTIVTPAGEYAIIKAGGYRFDVMPGRESRVKVLKGEVASGGQILRDGEAASLVAGVAGRQPAGKFPDDAFDEWSRNRAAALVESNRSLKQSDWYKKMTHGRGYLEISDDPAENDGNNAHVLSARNGVAGFVEEGVAVKSNERDWRELKPNEELADGDRVRSAPHSRAEVHPYPYFDLYLNGDTESIYRANADGDVTINVVRGSVTLVVSPTKVKRAERNILKLSANQMEYTISSPGYYRLNVFANGESEMLISSGSVVNAGKEIGSGKRVHGPNVVVSSFDRESRDSFDAWTLSRDAHSHFNSASTRRWFAGLWFLNSETSEYTFVPGDRTCKSPYGGSYSTMYVLNRGSGSGRGRVFGGRFP